MKNKFELPQPSKSNERGASLVEYALLVALIALIAAPSMGSLGMSTADTMDKAKMGIEGTYSLGGGECHDPMGCE